MDDLGTSCACYTILHMEADTRALWRGVRPLLGTTIGVGIFGLPYVFSQAGFSLALVEFIVIGALNTAALCLYADLVLARKRHAHFVSVISAELGFGGRFLATAAFFLTLWGAMVAYLIVSAAFIGLIVQIPPSTTVSLTFAAVASLFVVGGLPIMLRLHAVVIPAFFLLIGILFVLAVPHVEISHFTGFELDQAALPLGVILFAVSGLSAIPEVREALGQRARMLPQVIALGMACVLLVFLMFVIAILGFNGGQTTPDAITGIVNSAGRPVAILAATIGTLVVFSAFVTLGTSIMNTLLYDFRLRYGYAWLAAVGVPLVVFLMGARSFIDVIGTVGGLLGGVLGLLIVVAYEKARRSGELPKRVLRIPSLVVFGCFVLFLGMIVVTLVV